MEPKHDKAYLTASEVAELLMVSPNSIRVWADKGLLRADVTLGGHRRFPRAEVERLLAERRGEAPLPAPVPAPTAAPAAAGRRILVIDDEVDLAATVVDAITEAFPDAAVVAANDGFSGGQLSASFKPDLIVLDLMMPGLDGFEVCRRLKSDPATRDLRIIAVSGYASPENEQRILALGAECLLAKPLRIARLLEAIRLPGGVAATAA